MKPFQLIRRFTILIGIIFALHSCYWDSTEGFYPLQDNCDTLVISYASDVQSVLNTNCFSCHSAQNAPSFGSNIVLEGYNNTKILGSNIIGAIRHDDGYPPMPPNSPMLDSCSILKIVAWVNQGSMDN